jgi:hypothetical protein
MRPFTNAVRLGAVVLILPALAGCSEYVARHDGISIYGGDAMAGNQVKQMIDPWPAVAADRNIRYDGVVMQRAVQRYHANKVIAPSLGGTSSAYADAPAGAPQAVDAGPGPATPPK